jgi:hypothetical protein
MKRHIMCFIIIISIVHSVYGENIDTSNINGKWAGAMKGKSGRSIGNIFYFQVNGTELNGIVKGPYGNEDAIVDGRIDDNRISFNILVKFENYKIRFYYKGKVNINSIIFTITEESGHSKPVRFLAMKER